MSKNDIKSYLKINDDIVYQLNSYSKYTKVKFQEEFLNKIFQFYHLNLRCVLMD